MKRRTWFILLFLLICIKIISGQKLNSILVDAQNGLPVADAFIFFANSSQGTNSYPDGSFEIDQIDNPEPILIISHLNYLAKNLDLTGISNLPDTILLQPNNIVLEEVLVGSRSTPRIRKKRMNDFIKAFIGDNKGQVTIKNPEDLLLWENEDTLIVQASNPLYITNELLGYNLYYLLEDFRLYPNEDVKFEGQAFFQEIESKGRIRARYRKNRFQAYRDSKEFFFYNLVNDQLDTTRYKVGYSRRLPDRSFELFEELKSGQLIREEDSSTVIPCNYFFTVVDKTQRLANVLPKTNMPGTFAEIRPTAIRYQTSYLRSQSGKIRLNRQGVILNQQDIEEFGYWSTVRTSALLPHDYEPPALNSE